MPKKYTKEDVENWSVQEVQTWLVSVSLIMCVVILSCHLIVPQKKLTHYLPDFAVINGAQLLVRLFSASLHHTSPSLSPTNTQGMTNDDLKALPNVKGNEKKRK